MENKHKNYNEIERLKTIYNTKISCDINFKMSEIDKYLYRIGEDFTNEIYKKITSLSFYDHEKITSIEGIEIFENLEELEIIEGRRTANLKALIIAINTGAIKTGGGNFTNDFDITPLAALVKLKRLNLKYTKIKNKTPLQNLVNLKYLNLKDTLTTDITPLANLTNLKNLKLQNNDIKDITPLANLVNLERLNLEGNIIKDITPLQNLINLKYLKLGHNQIEDITPLKHLVNLKSLYFEYEYLYPPYLNGKILNLDRNPITDLSPLDDLVKKGLKIYIKKEKQNENN